MGGQGRSSVGLPFARPGNMRAGATTNQGSGSAPSPTARGLWRQAWHHYHDDVAGRNPALSIAVGIVLLAIGFIVPGTTRDVILRVAGVLALVAGAAMWVTSRRG